jgi:uncharacterized repeat protein (TIGR01451 family)
VVDSRGQNIILHRHEADVSVDDAHQGDAMSQQLVGRFRKAAAAAVLFLPIVAFATVAAVGPVYPPPTVNAQSVTFTTSDPGGNGNIGRAGGVTQTFSGIGVATAAKTWWGPGPVYPDSSPSSYIFEYNPTPFTFSSVDGVNHKVVYSTAPWSYLCVDGTGSRPVYQRFTMTYSSASTIVLDSAVTAGISDPNGRVGYVIRVTPGMAFTVNMLFEASVNGSSWMPGIDFFSTPCFAHPFQTNFEGGFYYSNSAPVIGSVANQTVYILSGGTAKAIGPLNFTIGDDGDPNKVTFTNILSSDTSVVQNADISVVNNANGTGSVSFTAQPPPAAGQGHTTISYDAVDGLGAQTPGSFDVLVDQPPVFDNGQTLNVGQGLGGTITNSLLHAYDPDNSDPATVTFNVQGQPHDGTLYLNGSAGPGTFTQADIDNNLVTYTQDNSCQTSDDFQFLISDSDGGYANDPNVNPDGSPTSYSFHINVNLTQSPPSAQGASLQTGLGQAVSSNVQATSTDCGPPTIAYALGTGPLHGNLTGPDASTGAFTYTPNLGFSGPDSFTFTASAYSGAEVSAPATISFTVQDQAPTAQPGKLVTHVNTAVNGNLVATDPDLPAQTLKYAVAAGPANGLVNVSNATTGAFTYVPNAGFAGNDSFTFTANDGSLTSTPGNVTVQVRQYPKGGDILVTNQGNPASIVLFDPVSAQQSILSDDAMVKQPYGIVVQSNGNILTTDGGPNGGPGYLLSIDPNSGAAAQFGTTNLPTSIGLALEASGDALVGLTTAGVIGRFDTSGNLTGPPIPLGGAAKPAPTGIAVAADGTLWVNDAEVFAGGTTNNLYHMNADGSSPTVVASDNFLNASAGIVLAGSTAYISTVGPFAGGAPTNIVAVDMGTGTQTLVTTDDKLIGSPGIGLAPLGNLYVTSIANARIVGVNASNGTQTILTQGGLLQGPWGLTVVPAPASGVDLSVTMAGPGGYIKETKPLVYTITVSNFGPDAATGAHVTAVTPPNVTGLTWTCVTNGSGSCGSASGGGSLNDSPNVPVGAVLTYTVTASAGLPEGFTMYAVSVQPATGITDVNLNNNQATSGLPEKIFADGFDN